MNAPYPFAVAAISRGPKLVTVATACCVKASRNEVGGLYARWKKLGGQTNHTTVRSRRMVSLYVLRDLKGTRRD
jgi:hypothetical protein